MVNPQMIQLARDARSWTQKDLAKTLGITQGALSKYEIGVLPVPNHILDAMASCLNFTQDFFLQRDHVVALGGDFLYRKKASVSAKARRQVEAEANIRKLQVERLLRNVSIDAPPDFPAIQPEEKNDRIERVAQEVRRAWRLPRGPIQNMTRLLENHGAIVFLADFGTRQIDGTNIRQAGLPPLLFLNKDMPGERHRFNLAHELGHVVMHFSATTGDAEEQAHTFASEFLMPRSDVRDDLRNLDLPAAARLKQVWGVSMQAIIVHARRLRKITESRYRRLFTSLSKQGGRLEEQFPLEQETPEAFDEMLRFYRQELGWTDEQLTEVLFTDKLGVSNPSEQPPMLKLTDPLFNQDD